MSKSPEQMNRGETSFAEENRSEYKHLFELQEKSTDPAIKEYFAEKIGEVIESAQGQMDKIHGEALVDKEKVDALISEADAELKTFKEKKSDLGSIRGSLEKLWHKADELGLETHKKEIAQILINPDLYAKHTCYWNDRFYIAHKSGLKERDLATRVIRNGMYEYFEPKTHSGYPLAELLKEEGVLGDAEFESIKNKEGGYSFLSPDAIKKLAERYNIGEEEIEGIALHLCMAGLSKSKLNDGIYDLDAASGWLKGSESVEQIAGTYLKPDLAQVVNNRAKSK